MTGVWVTADVITAARANEKTLFQGTSTEISAIVTTYAGMLAFCTTSGSSFNADTLYQRNSANTGWVVAGGSALSQVVMAHSATIGDYTTPSSATASTPSSSTSVTLDNVVTGTGTTATTRTLAITVASNSNRILIALVHHEPGSATTTSVKVGASNFTLASSGTESSAGDTEIWYLLAPSTGANNVDLVMSAGTNYAFAVYSLYNVSQTTPIGVVANSSGVSAQQPNGTITPTTTGSWILDGLTCQSTSSITLSLTSGYSVTSGASRYQASQYTTSPTINSSNSMSYSGLAGGFAWSWAAVEILTVLFQASRVLDTFTSGNNSRWTSSSENNPNIYIDAGSSKNICEIAWYHDATNTTETEVKIQTSTDASTWTDVRKITLSNLTNNAYNYIRFNVQLARYVRVYGTGTSKILSIWELKYLAKTDGQVVAGHGHQSLSSTDTSLSLSG